jgi:hypothetical protein
MFTKTLSKGMLVIAMGLAAPLALAQDDYITWNGGVGIDDRAKAPTEGTKLVFFSEQGLYIAGLHVTLKDNEGKVLVDTTGEGPWMILDLPDGTYTVLAEYQGFKQGGEIVVDEESEVFGYQFNNS